MLVLVIGLVVFFAIYLVPANAELRGGLVARFGETGYKAIFGDLSLVGLVLIVLGFYKLQIHPSKNPILWVPPVWARHIALALMLPAMIALVAAYVPSLHPHVAQAPDAGRDQNLGAGASARQRRSRGHLSLFGSFLAFAVYDRISVKRRHALGPLGATTGPWRNDIIVVVVGTALYLAIVLWLHQLIIGVSPLA